MPEGGAIALFIGLFIAAIVVISFVIFFVRTFLKRSQDAQAERQRDSVMSYQSHAGSLSAKQYLANKREQQAQQTALTKEQRERLDYLREQYKQRTADDAHEKHQADAHEHGHLGEEEHYEEIVGSLGDVNDEGCEDLDGVRFIAHDLAYEVTESDQHDYAKIAQAMVMGEILNNPRFHKPYTRK